MSDKRVLVSVDDGVCAIQLNRADKLNALTDRMYGQLVEALADAERDESVKVILLGSSSKHFCAGNDLADFLETKFDLESNVIHFLRRLATLSKPIIFAISGAAVGIGTTMLLHGDLVIASEKSKFSVPFIHLGLTPEGGSSVLLAERVGQSVANDWLYTGRTVSGNEAFDAGLVSRLEKADVDIFEVGLDLAREMAKASLRLLQQTKALLKSSSQQATVALIEKEAGVFAQRLGSKEAKAAFQQFLGGK